MTRRSAPERRTSRPSRSSAWRSPGFLDHRLSGGFRLLAGMVVAPEPAERFREDRPAVAVAVEALAVDESIVISRELEGLGHLLIGQRPVPVGVVQIVGSILEEDANRLLPGLANQGLVVVA